MTPFQIFVIENKKMFLKNAKDIYQFNQEFIKKCIDKFPDKCPNVFEEMKTEGQMLRNTKFFQWWINRKRYAENYKDKDYNEIIKTTKQKIIKKKVKERKVKEEVIKRKVFKKPTETIKTQYIEKQPVNQTIIKNNTYTKYEFQTSISKKCMKEIEEQVAFYKSIIKKTKTDNKKIYSNCEKILKNSFEFYQKEIEVIKRFYTVESNDYKKRINKLLIEKEKIKDPDSDEYKQLQKYIKNYQKSFFDKQKQLSRLEYDILNKYKSVYDIRDKQGNEYIKATDYMYKIQTIIRGIIENEKQFLENGFYRKEVDNNIEELSSQDILKIADDMKEKSIKENLEELIKD